MKAFSEIIHPIISDWVTYTSGYTANLNDVSRVFSNVFERGKDKIHWHLMLCSHATFPLVVVVEQQTIWANRSQFFQRGPCFATSTRNAREQS